MPPAMEQASSAKKLPVICSQSSREWRLTGSNTARPMRPVAAMTLPALGREGDAGWAEAALCAGLAAGLGLGAMAASAAWASVFAAARAPNPNARPNRTLSIGFQCTCVDAKIASKLM